MNIYSIRDNKSGVYNNPFYCVHLQDAKRQFARAANDDRLNLSMFSEDFDLYYLGVFDDQQGHFNLLDKPEFVMSAAEAKTLYRKDVTNGKS